MPNATIYIRKEDFDRWVAIENKSEWIHNQLRGVQSSGVTAERQEVGSSPTPPARQWSEVKSAPQPYIPPALKHPPELRYEPKPGFPNRYYHTEWEEYVNWTEKDGIT